VQTTGRATVNDVDRSKLFLTPSHAPPSGRVVSSCAPARNLAFTVPTATTEKLKAATSHADAEVRGGQKMPKNEHFQSGICVHALASAHSLLYFCTHT